MSFDLWVYCFLTLGFRIWGLRGFWLFIYGSRYLCLLCFELRDYGFRVKVFWFMGSGLWGLGFWFNGVPRGVAPLAGP